MEERCHVFLMCQEPIEQKKQRKEAFYMELDELKANSG